MRKIILGFSGFCLVAILALVVWFLSWQPSQKSLDKAFLSESYKTFNQGKITLYSLKPNGEIQGSEKIQGYSVLGKTEIDSEITKSLLRRSFIQSMSLEMVSAACFNPRHGLSIVDESGSKAKIDLIICFECGGFISCYEDSNGNKLEGEGETMGLFAEPLFNRILKSSNIGISD